MSHPICEKCFDKNYRQKRNGPSVAVVFTRAESRFCCFCGGIHRGGMRVSKLHKELPHCRCGQVAELN